MFVQMKAIACKIFSLLKAATLSIPSQVDMYHVSNTESTIAQVCHDFSGQTQLRCLVTTIAFGMVRESTFSTTSYSIVLGYGYF